MNSNTVNCTRPLLVALLLLGLSFAPAFGQTAEEILEAHVQATGGKDRLMQVETVRQSGELIFKSDYAGAMEGTIEIAVVPRKKIFRSSDLGAFSSKAAWDGTTGWEQGIQGLRTLEGEELEQLKAQSEIFFATGLWRDPESTIERVDDEDLDGQPHYVLQYGDVSASGITVYIDQETHLISQMVNKVNIPGVGEAVAVTDLWDYHTHDGIVLPKTMSLSIEGIFSSETTFTETVINGQIDDNLFAKPE